LDKELSNGYDIKGIGRSVLNEMLLYGRAGRAGRGLFYKLSRNPKPKIKKWLFWIFQKIPEIFTPSTPTS